MLFSQRKGYKKIKELIQKESMDSELRNGLWNAIQICVLDLIRYEDVMYSPRPLKISNLYGLFCNYWIGYFKHPLDTMPRYFDEALKLFGIIILIVNGMMFMILLNLLRITYH